MSLSVSQPFCSMTGRTLDQRLFALAEYVGQLRLERFDLEGYHEMERFKWELVSWLCPAKVECSPLCSPA